MKVLFGPVASRRLGRSLGLDLLPFKTCTYDCIYCELGPTTRRTVDPVSPIQPEQVLRELEAYLQAHPGEIDFLTISGSGEPTLYPHLGSLIRALKTGFALPVAVITNSSLLYKPEVLERIAAADLIIPSLDAVDAPSLEAVNRPHPDLTLDSLLEGLRALGCRGGPRVWLEVLFVQGLNDRPDQIEQLLRFIAEINPEKIQINTVVRPPVEGWARPLPWSQLEAIREKIGPRAEVIAPSAFQNQSRRWPEAEILDLLARRPCTVEELSRLTGLTPEEIHTRLQPLAGQKIIHRESFNRTDFYRLRTPKSDMGGC